MHLAKRLSGFLRKAFVKDCKISQSGYMQYETDAI